MDNILLKDVVKKVIFDKPILNTEVSVSDILLIIQRVKDVCVGRRSWRGVVPVKLTERRKNSDLTESLIGTKH